MLDCDFVGQDKLAPNLGLAEPALHEYLQFFDIIQSGSLPLRSGQYISSGKAKLCRMAGRGSAGKSGKPGGSTAETHLNSIVHRARTLWSRDFPTTSARQTRRLHALVQAAADTVAARVQTVIRNIRSRCNNTRSNSNPPAG